jgi:hypothetical protein
LTRLIVDEPGFLRRLKSCAGRLFARFRQRYARISTLARSNLPFAGWTKVPRSERHIGR